MEGDAMSPLCRHTLSSGNVIENHGPGSQQGFLRKGSISTCFRKPRVKGVRGAQSISTSEARTPEAQIHRWTLFLLALTGTALPQVGRSGTPCKAQGSPPTEKERLHPNPAAPRCVRPRGERTYPSLSKEGRSHVHKVSGLPAQLAECSGT